MARNLDQLFRAGEQVLHHVPEGRLKPNWGSWLTGMAAFGALVLLFSWLTMEPEQVGNFAIFWAIAWAIVTPLSLFENRTVETAVTEHRVLHIEEGPAKYTEVNLEKVATVMALGQCVHITKPDGGIVLLKHQGHATDIAAAIARAAGLPSRRTPLKMRIAQNVTQFASALGMGAGLGLIFRFAPDPNGALEIILRILSAASAAIAGGIAAGFLAIAALRPFLTKDELHARVQGDASILPWVRPDPRSPSLLRRLLSRYVDWLYRRASAQLQGPTKGNDR